MTLDMILSLIRDLEQGPRSLREDKYYEALCLLCDVMPNPNFHVIAVAINRAKLSGKEFMSIDANGVVTNLDRKEVTLTLKGHDAWCTCTRCLRN